MISGVLTGADLPTHFSTSEAQAAIDAAFGNNVVQIVGQFTGSLPDITLQAVKYEQIAEGEVSVNELKTIIKNLSCTEEQSDAAILQAQEAAPSLLARIEALEVEVAALKAK